MFLCCALVDQGVVIASIISKSAFVNDISSLRISVAAGMGRVLFFLQARATDYHASIVLPTMAQTSMLLDCECFYGCSRVLFHCYVRIVCVLLDYALHMYFRVL